MRRRALGLKTPERWSPLEGFNDNRGNLQTQSRDTKNQINTGGNRFTIPARLTILRHACAQSISPSASITSFAFPFRYHKLNFPNERRNRCETCTRWQRMPATAKSPWTRRDGRKRWPYFSKSLHKAPGQPHDYDSRTSFPSVSPSFVFSLTPANVTRRVPFLERARVFGEIAVPETWAHGSRML